MIKVISIDDHEMISIGLEKLFSSTKDIIHSGYCKTKSELENLINSKYVDDANNFVALVDIKLENESGFDCAGLLICLYHSAIRYSVQRIGVLSDIDFMQSVDSNHHTFFGLHFSAEETPCSFTMDVVDTVRVIGTLFDN